MSALCDCTFDTRVESIAGEEGQDIGLPGELWVITVVIYKGLEPRHPTDRLCRARSIRDNLISSQVEVYEARGRKGWRDKHTRRGRHHYSGSSVDPETQFGQRNK